MLDYLKVIDDSNAFKIIELDGNSSRLSHAYMFVAEDSNYLMAFCERVCKFMINLDETENKEKNELRIEKRNHPDVAFHGVNKKIDKDTVLDIIEKADYTPFEADKKIYVLWNADDMTEIVQNKILKTIEEPPANTYFILACKSVSKFLPTIMSRIKKIELDQLKTETICAMLESKGISHDKAEIYAACANGSGEFAEKLATDENFLDFFNQVISCCFEINGSRDVLKYSNLFSSKSIDKNELLDILMLVCRDIQMIIAGKPELVTSKNSINKLKVISSMLNFDATVAMIETIIKAKQKLHFNVNSTAVIDDVLFKLAEVKVKCRRL